MRIFPLFFGGILFCLDFFPYFFALFLVLKMTWLSWCSLVIFSVFRCLSWESPTTRILALLFLVPCPFYFNLTDFFQIQGCFCCRILLYHFSFGSEIPREYAPLLHSDLHLCYFCLDMYHSWCCLSSKLCLWLCRSYLLVVCFL